MSAATASAYVRRMVELESRGSGDTERALRHIEAHFGLPYWPMWHLRKGKAKTVDAALFERIRLAYLAFCERKVAALQAELENEKAIAPDDDLATLEAAASELAAKIAEAKARRRAGRLAR